MICRKDTAALIEATILPCLTKGLKTLSGQSLHLYKTNDGPVICTFDAPTTEIEDIVKIKVEVYNTGDLAYQMMTQGREGMSGAHCMLCQLTYKEFNNYRHRDGVPWTFTKFLCTAKQVIDDRHGVPLMGVKQEPWWAFLKFEHHMVPLLHCMIGIGNNLLDKFCDLIRVHCEKLSAEEITFERQIRSYKSIISTTVTERDEFDNSPAGKKLKSLIAMIAFRRRKIIHKDTPASTVGKIEADMMSKQQEIKPLVAIRHKLTDRLQGTRTLLTENEKAYRAMQSSKASSRSSLESAVFKILKRIGVEQSSYHGGSLNGKDIKKVMNSAAHLFDQFSSLLQAGKRDECELDNNSIDAICQNFKNVFVLWDGAFSLARTKYPTSDHSQKYQQFINAAVIGHVNLGLTITPKVHLMFKHVSWQMDNITGGLGDKMEDWIEKSHQDGKQLRARFRTITNLQERANARARVVHWDTTPVIINQILTVEKLSKRKYTGVKADKDGIKDLRECERWAKRIKALDDHESIAKTSEYALILSGLKSSTEATLRIPKNHPD